MGRREQQLPMITAGADRYGPFLLIDDFRSAMPSAAISETLLKIIDQHATLTEQRDRLAAVLRQIRTAATNVASYDRALANIKKLAKDALATVEQGGEG